MVQLLKSRPHLSQSAVEFLLCQLHLARDPSRVLMCHALAAIATQLPVLGEGMLGDLVDLYRVASHSSTDKQQELLVRDTQSPNTNCHCPKGTNKVVEMKYICLFFTTQFKAVLQS